MKKIHVLAVAVLSSVAAFSNYSVDWLRTADSYLKSGAMITRDNADNVVVAGSAVTSSIYIQKYDKFGNLQWERSSSSGIQSNYETSTWVNTDAQNNVYVTGYRYSYSTQPPNHFPNAIIVLKYDAAGTLQWKFILEGSFGITIPYSYSALRFRSELDANGNLYVGTSGNITGNATGGFILVKLNPQGNMVWNRTSTAGSIGGFLSMRLRNNRVVLTGSSATYFGNVASAMFDTSGNEIWRATTVERGGQDVELDDIGNAYILTGNYNEISPTSGLDILVLKYNSAGAQLARYKYNFANTESGARLCRTGSNELGIAGNGYFGGAFTSDWLVMKINMSSGALLWSKTDINTSPYDVAAANLIGNAAGELFVTGTKPNGKPFPGYLAMGTRKYLTDGSISWTALYDSTASRGTALSMASNGSIYALGSSYATVLHYFDLTGTGNCNTPDTTAVTNIKNTSVVIEFRKNPSAFVYHIQYKTIASPKWTTISTDKTRFVLKDLSPGTTYQFRVEAVCNSGPSGYGAMKEFTTLGVGYCVTGGTNSSNDWINFVWLGSIMNASVNDNGYGDYTYISGSIVQNSFITGFLSSSFNGFNTQYFRVWIDFNIDGDFNDPGEKVIDTLSASGWTSVHYTVPATAKLGKTRMRVSLRNGAKPTPCGIYPLGETEDYSVVIIAPLSYVTAVQNALNVRTQKANSSGLLLWPNPAVNTIQIRHSFSNNMPVYITIKDVNGRTVAHSKLTGNTVDISKLSNGSYMVQLQQGSLVESGKLVILK